MPVLFCLLHLLHFLSVPHALSFSAVCSEALEKSGFVPSLGFGYPQTVPLAALHPNTPYLGPLHKVLLPFGMHGSRTCKSGNLQDRGARLGEDVP